MSDWKVRISWPWHMDAADIVMYRERVDGGIELMQFEAPTLRIVNEGEAIEKPTLSLPSRIARPLLQAMADTLHADGVRATSQSFIEGELAATKEHLKDMRELVMRRKTKEL